MRIDEYMDIENAISRTMLMAYRDSPELYYQRYVDKTAPPVKPTPAMLFGTMIDDYLTENIRPGTELPPNVVVGPTATRRGNEWKDFAAAHKDSHMQLWTQNEVNAYRDESGAQLEICQRVANQIADHPKAAPLVFNANRITQPAYVFPIGTHQFNAKAKPDIVVPDCIVDIKTSASVSAEHFAKQTDRYGYHVQHVLCRRGYAHEHGESLPMVFVVIRSSEPYDVEVYELSEEFSAIGSDIVSITVGQIENCHETGVWRSATHGRITTVEPPRYLKYRAEFEMDG